MQVTFKCAAHLLDSLMHRFLGYAVVVQVDEAHFSEAAHDVLRGLLLLCSGGRIAILAEVNERDAEGVLRLRVRLGSLTRDAWCTYLCVRRECPPGIAHRVNAWRYRPSPRRRGKTAQGGQKRTRGRYGREHSETMRAGRIDECPARAASAAMFKLWDEEERRAGRYSLASTAGCLVQGC